MTLTRALSALKDLPGGIVARVAGIKPGVTAAAFFICFFALGWAGVVLEIRADRARSVARFVDSNENLARAFEEHAIRTMRHADQILLLVKARYEGARDGFDPARHRGDEMFGHQPFDSIEVSNAAGEIVGSTTSFEPARMSDPEALAYHAANPRGGLFIGKPLAAHAGARPLIHLSRRIEATDGSFGGIVALGLDPEYFSSFYSQIDMGNGGAIALVGRDGIVRARRADRISSAGQDVSGSRTFAGIVLGKDSGSYVARSEVDGTTRLLSFRALKQYPLVVLVGTAESTALEAFRHRRAALLWTAAVASLVILLFGALFWLQTRGRAALARRLRDAEARLSLAVERVADYAIFTLDKRGHVTSWNTGAERIKGYREAEILGEHVSRFHSAEDVAFGVPDRLLAEAASKGSAEQEGWRVRKDGKRFWAHVVITALRNKAGALAGYGKITRDLTSAKLAEDALVRSEARFRAIFDQAAVGIGEVSLQGRWLRANRRMCEIAGYPLEELLTKTIRDITHPDDLDATNAHARSVAARRGRSRVVEKRYVRKDGGVVWVSLSSVLVRGTGGEPDYIVGVVEDISARKRAEIEAEGLRARLEQRVEQRTAELAQANKRLESFSYSVSHDLRTPLRAISGFAQILARRHRENLNDEGRHYMDNIVRASAQMGRLIEDLLNYSRLGRSSVAMEPVALEDIVGDLVRQMHPRIAETGANLRVGALPAVTGDPTLLTQIFINLLDNALTYRRAGVQPAVEVSARTEGETVVVSVSDNGIGIDAKHFELIFGIFQRLHSDDQYPGTGIGLATVRRAVEMLGGEAWVESEPGAGSTFHVRLQSARPTAGP